MRPASTACSARAGRRCNVGKARSLKKRVSQYASGKVHHNRLMLMVDLTRSMEFTTTRTEADALLLEINLIKQLKPRFNVLLRDDKSFPRDRHPSRAPGGAAAQASRRPLDQGRLFRPVRQRLGGEPHAEHPAEGLPAAVVLRQRLREPAPGRACCTRSGAARRRAPGWSRSTTIRGWSARPRPSCAARAER